MYDSNCEFVSANLGEIYEHRKTVHNRGIIAKRRKKLIMRTPLKTKSFYCTNVDVDSNISSFNVLVICKILSFVSKIMLLNRS